MVYNNNNIINDFESQLIYIYYKGGGLMDKELIINKTMEYVKSKLAGDRKSVV